MRSNTEIEYKNGRLYIFCPFHANDIVRELPSRKFNKRMGCWVAPLISRNVAHIRQNMSGAEVSPEAEQAMGDVEILVASKEQFPSWYKFKTEPMAHQIKALNKAWGNDCHGFLFEQGLGKTWTFINWAAALRMDNKIDAAMVVCPSSIKHVWKTELGLHCPIETQAFAMSAGKNNKAIEFMRDKHDFPWLVIGVEALSQGSAYKVMEEFVQTRRVAMGIDESSRIKNHSAGRTEKVTNAGGHAAYRAILSGTPVTQGVQDLFSQLKFLNMEILGFDDFYSFRNHFCLMGGFDKKKIIGYINVPELLELIGPFVSREVKSECLDLPPKIYEQRVFDMAPEQMRMYKSLKKDMIAEVVEAGHRLEVETVLEQMMRLQQITGGFYSIVEDIEYKINKKTGEEKAVKKYVNHNIPGKNPKIAELMNFMDDTFGSFENKDAKLIIWARFIPEIELIWEALSDAGWSAVEYSGRMNDDQKLESFNRFQHGDAQVFVSNQMTGGIGLTLTACNNVVYYSNTFSLEDRLQSEDRCHRKGTTNKVLYVDLCCEKTVDIHVHRVLEGKMNVAEYVSQGLRKGTVDDWF
jgi:SNF2 family DNA or RNA helicase